MKKNVRVKRRSHLISEASKLIEDVISQKTKFKDLLLMCQNMKVLDETRKFVWFLFLDLLPLDNHDVDIWIKILTEKRNKYFNLIFEGHHTKVDKEEIDLIELDVERTFQDVDLFRNNTVKVILINVLKSWSIKNSDLGYIQGMNEIAATALYAIYPAIKPCHDKTNFYELLNDEEKIEEDLFILFDELMNRSLKSLYGYCNKNIQKTACDLVNPELNFKSDKIDFEKLLVQNVSELKKRIHKIFHFYLKLLDKKLYDHLLNITDPYLYMFRWILCLLNREFDIKSTIVIWDIIFAYEIQDQLTLNLINKINGTEEARSLFYCYKLKDLNFLDFLIIAMLDSLHKLPDFYKNDDNELLSLLMHFPVERILLIELIHEAENIRERLLEMQINL